MNALLAYIRAHWRGEHSLARSYWANGMLLTGVVATLVFFVSRLLIGLPLAWSALLWLLIVLLMATVSVWQLLGIWRSARRTVAETGRWAWARVAQALVVLGAVSGSFNLFTIGSDLAKLFAAVHQPMLTEYRIAKPEPDEIALFGAINEDSVTAVMQALMDPAVDRLRITSHGGLLEPALRLARYVATNNVVVIAQHQCLSACVLVMAASPFAALEPGTEVVLHRTQPLLDIANPDFRRENELYLRQTMDYYRDFGLPEWAIERMEVEGLWAPSLDEQIHMGLLKYVYDDLTRQFTPAPVYCARFPKACATLPKSVTAETLDEELQ